MTLEMLGVVITGVICLCILMGLFLCIARDDLTAFHLGFINLLIKRRCRKQHKLQRAIGVPCGCTEVTRQDYDD